MSTFQFFILLLEFASCFPGSAPEPWAELHGGSFSGFDAPLSPDPLVKYVWPDIATVNDTALQIFAVAPVSCGAAANSDPHSFGNASECVGTLNPYITVSGAGTLIVDFGVELPAWLEFDSPDLPVDAQLELGISEYTTIDYVGGFKRGGAKAYGTTYRLETNDELYEGVRYGFIVVKAPPTSPWHITGLRAVSQAKPMNYVGSFFSAGDPLLEKVWWTAAYTVRATAQSTYMGSILMDRGDRFSWTGDAHPSQATSMAVFGNYDFVFNNLNRSKADCQGIATYCLYFVLSVSDYFRETGDAAGVHYLTPYVVNHLESAASMWDKPEGLRFVGWDDRLGSGFANNTTPETQALYRLLAIRAWTAAAFFFNATGNSTLSSRYSTLASTRVGYIRGMGGSPWYGEFGMHARAEAVTAGFLTPEELVGVGQGPLGDPVQLPSQSNFNQYFILQALSGLGQLDRGMESIRAIWGPITTLGATTFWETSHPSAALIFSPGPPPPAAEQSGWVSYCHPWSSGPAPWLTAWILGVQATAPGYASVLLSPHLGVHMTDLWGSAPTPQGPFILNLTRGGVVFVTLPPSSSTPTAISRVTLRLSSITLFRLGLDLPGGRFDDLATVTSLVSSSRGVAREGSIDRSSSTARKTWTPMPELAHKLIPSAVVASTTSLGSPHPTPLLDESNPGGKRCAAIEIELPPLALGVSYRVELSVSALQAAQPSTIPAPDSLVPTPRDLQSPFPPPVWPGALLASDSTTGGNWKQAGFGKEGYVLLAFDKPTDSGSNPFCGSQEEGSALSLKCLEAGAHITGIPFASYGNPFTSHCPSGYTPGPCSASTNVSAIVSSACTGKTECSVDVSNAAFGGDPCPGVSKELALVATCSSGGGVQPGAEKPPSDRVLLPSWVSSARTVSYDGYCGATRQWVNFSTDVRALEDPDDSSSGRRALGFMQPCGCPTAPFDIQLTDAALAAGKRYKLGLYFVDWAPSPDCQAFDGTARSQELYLLTGYPQLAPLAERVALTNFTGGMWLFYELQGNARVRISSIVGDFAVLSAATFDELSSTP